MKGRIKNNTLVFGTVALILMIVMSSVYGVSISKITLDTINKNFDESDKVTICEVRYKNMNSIKSKLIISRCQQLRNKIFDEGRSLPIGFPQKQSVTINGEEWDMVVPDDYTSIQAAVKAVGLGNGYRIFVRSGMYHENVVIDIDGVILHGEDREYTIIDGGLNGHVLTLDADYNTISGFIIQNSGFDNAGIFFNVSSGNQIFDCKIINNHESGLYIYRSRANNITENIISENGCHGLYLENSTLGNIITNNFIKNNENCGILINDASRSNIVAGNNIEKNNFGVKITGFSDNTILHHNVFMGNIQNGFDDSENIWDDSIGGGNYWDDYNGTDSDGDGVGDIPYNIPGGKNKDRFPLLNQPIKKYYFLNIIHDEEYKDESTEIVSFSFSSGDTIIVPDDFPIIQDAVDNSSDGDTILVRAGVYYENIIVDKSVNILGDSNGNTIVDGIGSGHIFNIIADNVQISGFTITNTNLGSSGIKVNSDSCIIKNNIIKNCGDGVHLFSSEKSVIKENLLNGNNYGIYLHKTSICLIQENVLSRNSEGIAFWSSSNIELIKNIFENNSFTGLLYLWTNKNLISNNAVKQNNDSGIQIFSSEDFSIQNNIIDNNKGDGISFYKTKQNNISKNTLINNDGIGISFRFSSSNNNINENILNKNSLEAIYLTSSSNNIILNNTISYCCTHYTTTYRGAITLSKITDSTVIYNKIKNNIAGINIHGSENLISRNLLENNGIGIQFSHSSNNICIENNIKMSNLYGNTLIGIDLFYSDNNTINNNKIINEEEKDIFPTFSYGIIVLRSNNNYLNYNIINGMTTATRDDYANSFGISVNGNNNIINYNKINNTKAIGKYLLADTDTNAIGIWINGFNNTFSYNNISDTFASGKDANSYGFELLYFGPTESTIHSNIVKNTTARGLLNVKSFGVWLYSNESPNTTISDNIIIDTKAEALLVAWSAGIRSSSNNTINYNIVYKTIAKGLTFDATGIISSNNCNISNNIVNKTITNGIEGCSYGISCDDDNKLFSNKVSNITLGGLFSEESAGMKCHFNNIISKNTVTRCKIGIETKGTSKNHLYLNNLIENERNALGSAGENTWDNGVMGNYWDDYQGMDADSDDIGDSPYNIPGSNNVDQFPLMEFYNGG
jgi:parallel beta-helix repeat protein